MPRIIRTPAAARDWMRELSRKGATTLPPDHVAVQGHCAGSVARAYCNAAAGYVDAHAMIDAVSAAGKIRRNTKAPLGAVMMWRGGKHGHVALAARFGYIWTVDLPRSNRIGRVRRALVRERWGYQYVGWCLAEDIPGWSKLRRA